MSDGQVLEGAAAPASQPPRPLAATCRRQWRQPPPAAATCVAPAISACPLQAPVSSQGAPTHTTARLATACRLLLLQDGGLPALPLTKSFDLVGHSKAVTALEADHNGARLVAGSNDYTCHLYDFGGLKADGKSFRSFEVTEGHPVVAVSAAAAAAAAACCSH